MEKDAAGYPSLPLHYGLTNPGTGRTSPAAYLTQKDAGDCNHSSILQRLK
jgi:hypothetical protein